MMSDVQKNSMLFRLALAFNNTALDYVERVPEMKKSIVLATTAEDEALMAKTHADFKKSHHRTRTAGTD